MNQAASKSITASVMGQCSFIPQELNFGSIEFAVIELSEAGQATLPDHEIA
jgi:hypothetical protein